MSLQEFWYSVRTAAREIFPAVVADSPLIDSSYLSQALHGTTLWLTSSAVEGFELRDFEFLSEADRKKLDKSVGRFLNVAEQVSSPEAATEAQFQEALPAFQDILEVLRPDKYADPEALELGVRIAQKLAGKIPPTVAEFRFQTGEDWTGGPALWIWVVFKDEASDELFLKNARAVRELLEHAVRQLKMERWPYVRFRTISELDPPMVRGASK